MNVRFRKDDSMEKILTISIAAYNAEKYIEGVLLPLLKANRPERLEVLIIDDGGTDGTLEIAQRYEREYPDIFKAVHKENGGWGSTVTIGISMAKGKYFKLLDGDDYYEPKGLSKLLDYMEMNDCDMIMTPFVRFYENSDRIEHVDNPIYHINKPTAIELESLPITPYCMEMYSVAFRTELIQEANIRITEHCFYTDNEYVVKCSCLCKSVTVLPDPVYYYRLARPGQSVSVEGMKKHYREFETILRKMLPYIRDNVASQNVKELYLERYRELSYHYFEMLFQIGPGKEYQQAMKNYDQWLKKDFPEIYKSIKYRKLWIMRMTKYMGFDLLVERKTK